MQTFFFYDVPLKNRDQFMVFFHFAQAGDVVFAELDSSTFNVLDHLQCLAYTIPSTRVLSLEL